MRDSGLADASFLREARKVDLGLPGPPAGQLLDAAQRARGDLAPVICDTEEPVIAEAGDR